MLMDKGKAFCEEIIQFKKKAENDVAQKIGHENVDLLKRVLQEGWGE